MIGRLQGQVVERQLDGSIILDVQGVGYEVFVPTGALGRLGAAEGADQQPKIVLHVHAHVREDAFHLYGFESSDDKYAFRALLSVNGIGPKLALSILSTLDAASLARAIQTEDRAALKGISGVGKKTVERILLDLKDKLVVSVPTSVGTRPAPLPPASGPLAVVASALVSMGYKPAAADKACEGLDPAGKSTSELLREALMAISS